VALKAALGEIGPMPDAAIFSDTQWEPLEVYNWLYRLEEKLPFPIYRVTEGNIRDDAIAKVNTTGQRFASIPWFIQKFNGEKGMGQRQCTQEYKLKPLRKKVRELLGGKTPAGGATIWIGISTDEAHRMKPSRQKYMVNRWPLIELGMSRNACIAWLASKGFTVPKSSCIGCPYHSNAQWRALTPSEFEDACQVDELIREQPDLLGKQYVHRDCKPLREVDLRSAEQAGQFDLFGEECEGMCGL
jgi:hypothetical protein